MITAFLEIVFYFNAILLIVGPFFDPSRDTTRLFESTTIAGIVCIINKLRR
jgi:hypothetical protein